MSRSPAGAPHRHGPWLHCVADGDGARVIFRFTWQARRTASERDER